MNTKQRIKNYRDAIKDLSQWKGSKEVFGYIDSNAGRKVSYIYEFYCGMCLLKDLSRKHTILVVKRNSRVCFPKSPGNKVNYSYFEVSDKGGTKKLNQFCFGTEIQISSSFPTTFSSDLSIQLNKASDTPDEKDIVLLFDAKYRSKHEGNLDISTIREFAKCVDDMLAPKSKHNHLQFTDYTDLNANCLITNRDPAILHLQYCINNKIKQIGKFDYDEQYAVIG